MYGNVPSSLKQACALSVCVLQCNQSADSSSRQFSIIQSRLCIADCIHAPACLLNPNMPPVHDRFKPRSQSKLGGR